MSDSEVKTVDQATDSTEGYGLGYYQFICSVTIQIEFGEVSFY